MKGMFTPFGTSRYSVNFDEPTLPVPSAPMVTWPPLVAGAFCAATVVAVMRSPMATNADIFIARVMGDYRMK